LDQNATSNNLLSIRNIPHNQKHTQTKSKGLENDLPGMQKLKASRGSYSRFRQSRFYTKMRQRRAVNTNKRAILQKDTILNIYTPKIFAPIFIKQTLLISKEHTGPYTIIMGDLNTPTVFNIQKILIKNQQRCPRTKQYHG
jgi:hypothetical protein